MVWMQPVHFLFRLDVCCRVKPIKALRKIFSLHGHTTLHYDCHIIIADFFETQDNWNVLPLAAYPRHHDTAHCMYSSSRISNATNHVCAPASCCAAVAAAAQQRWAAAQRNGMPQVSACRAGLQPSEPKKIAKAGPLAVEGGQQPGSRPGRDGGGGRSN